MQAFGIGIATLNERGNLLEVYYPQPVLTPSSALLAALQQVLGELPRTEPIIVDSTGLHALAEVLGAEDLTAALLRPLSELKLADRTRVLLILIDTTADPDNVADVYLRLHLLSHRLKKPHEVNLQGMFGILPNVAWTSEGAIDLPELPGRQLVARAEGRLLRVFSVDKFPTMADYVVPSGVRIGDASRVRLGASLGEGTTVMHEGFVNFNAGTLGKSMIEGRISAGVVVGEGSDLGGGCSTMGTLSGGGNLIISVGNDSLIGANAGIGIPLGNRCTVEAGLYLTAGTKVSILDREGKDVEVVAARTLANRDDLLFRRNSQSGRVEVLPLSNTVTLNEGLHAHN